MMRDILTAFRTLTILPLPGKDTKDFSRALFFFPLVGGFLGSISMAFLAGAERIGFVQFQVVAALCVGLITLLTGCLHVDGIGDVADAFGSGKGKAHMIEVLKDPAMGSFGVTAIVLDLLIKVWCWQFFFALGEAGVVVWSMVFARSVQSLFIAFIPNARTGSIAGAFSTKTPFAKAMVVLSFLLTVSFTAFVSSLSTAFVCASSSLVVSALFGLYCIKKIGGITGDCVGAANELVEISVLLSAMMVI